MQITYANNKVEKQCTELKRAKKDFPAKVANKLFKLIDFIEAAESLEDVISFPPYRFHNLKGNKKGLYALDIDGKKGKYRLLVSFAEEDTDQVFSNSMSIEAIILEEVSNHYE